MSDAACTAARPNGLRWFEHLDADSGFAVDPRFTGTPVTAPEPAPDGPDEVETRIAAAFEEGRALGHGEAEKHAVKENGERRKLGSALRRMDEDMQNRLSEQLSATVAALCAATLEPLTLDSDLLARRCAKAAALLADSRDATTLFLHPDDINRLDESFATQWRIEADPSLAPGALRLEGSEGGISDGPEEWQRLLAEALAGC